MSGRFDLTLRKWKPEIAQLEFTQMAAYASQCAPAKTVLIEHDITIDLYQQLLEDRKDPNWPSNSNAGVPSRPRHGAVWIASSLCRRKTSM